MRGLTINIKLGQTPTISMRDNFSAKKDLFFRTMILTGLIVTLTGISIGIEAPEFGNNDISIDSSADKVAVWNEDSEEHDREEFRKEVNEFEEADGGALELGNIDGAITLEMPPVMDDGDGNLELGEEVKLVQGNEEINYETESNIEVKRGPQMQTWIVITGDVGLGEYKLRSKDEFVIPKEYYSETVLTPEDGTLDIDLARYVEGNGEIKLRPLSNSEISTVTRDIERPELENAGKDIGDKGDKTTKLSFEISKSGESPLDTDSIEDNLKDFVEVQSMGDINPSITQENVNDDVIEFSVSFDSLESSDKLNIDVKEGLVQDQAGNPSRGETLSYSGLHTGKPEVEIQDVDFDGDYIVKGDEVTVNFEVRDILTGFEEPKVTFDASELGKEEIQSDVSEKECGGTYCTYSGEETFEFDGSGNEDEREIRVVAEDQNENEASKGQTVDLKLNFAGTNKATLEGAGEVERAIVEFNEEIESPDDEDLAAGWQLEYEDHKSIGFEGGQLSEEGKKLTLEVSDAPKVSDTSKINLTYDSYEGNLESVHGINIGSMNGNEFTEIDEIEPELRKVHLKEGIDKGLMEFTEPIDGVEGHELRGWESISNIETFSQNGEGYAVFDVGRAVTEKDGDFDTKFSVKLEGQENGNFVEASESNVIPVREGWNLISVNADEKVTDLDKMEWIERSISYNSEYEEEDPNSEMWEERGELSRTEGTYMKTNRPGFLKVEETDTEDGLVPIQSANLNNGWNLLSPIDRTGLFSATVNEWAGGDTLSQGSEIYSPKENQEEFDLNPDCDEENDNCEWSEEESVNVYEGYWVWSGE